MPSIEAATLTSRETGGTIRTYRLHTSAAEAGQGWLPGMPDLVYQTADGLQVTLDEQTWTHHIQPRHPEVTDQNIAQTLTRPVRICAHTSIPMRRIYQGSARTSGFFKESFPLVVVSAIGERTGRVYYGLPRTTTISRTRTMASPDDILELDYDAENDVLYASLGTPQAALSAPISELIVGLSPDF
jgi:hypothetical protein